MALLSLLLKTERTSKMEHEPQDRPLVIPMPSPAELIGFLEPRRMLALEGSIETHSRAYQQAVQERGYKGAPSQFVAFVIPLSSYLPLPEAYGSTFHEPHQRSASMTLVHHAAMEAQIGFNKLTAVVTSLVVALGNEHSAKPLADLDEVTIMALYREAIRLANHMITAFKLTPDLHNHDLQPVTVRDRPSYVDMLRFDTAIGQILEAGNVGMHQNLTESVHHHASPMDGRAHSDFSRSVQLLGARGDEAAANVLATIYRAIDAVCIGHFESGMVLSDTYAEHTMRYALLLLYTGQGWEQEAAMGKIDSLRTLDKLLGGLAEMLNVKPPDLKRAIEFEAWKSACRVKRNHITHRFTKVAVEPDEARDALHTTIGMIARLARFIIRRNVGLAPHLLLFETPGFYTDSFQAYDANDDRSIGRVANIVKYVYHKPGDPLPDLPSSPGAE
jgi:hypothetical protein